jgi:hypothetical protein
MKKGRPGFHLLAACLIFLNISLTFAFPANAQPPQPVPPPPLNPENNPLSPSNATAPLSNPLPGPQASGGNAAFPEAINATIGNDDRWNTNPTGWFVYEHQTAQNITDFINANQANNTPVRLVDISIETISPSYLFSVAYVYNSGSYAKSWWWYYNIDAATVTAYLSQNNARLITLKPLDAGNGNIRFTVLMISNTGADATAWWWYYNETIPSLASLVSTNNARLTQIHSYVTGGQTLYAAVMVDNSGAAGRTWWWYINLSVSSISSLITSNNARLVDLDYDPSTSNYNIIMDSCASGCPLWWWYYGIPTSQLLTLAAQDGARMIDVNTRPGCSDVCWDFLLINNSNAITSRVGQMLRGSTDGTVGLYLKQVGGPVLASLMDNTPFEPASTIKVAVHLYTMMQLQAGNVTLSTMIPQYQPPATGSCPGTTVIGSESIQTADREMMWHSDNTRTAELVDYFGRANINVMISSIGMSNTSINHVLGCGGPIPNQTTLDDLAVLYEGVANGALLNSSYQSLFFSMMAGKSEFLAEGYDWTHLWDTDIPAIISQEAPLSMPASLKTAFQNNMDLAYKAGNYKICGTTCATYVDDISIFGYVKIPFCGLSSPREYAFGVYIYNATSDANSSNAFNATKAELLREQIRAGLATCFYQTYLPRVNK